MHIKIQEIHWSTAASSSERIKIGEEQTAEEDITDKVSTDQVAQSSRVDPV